MREREIFDLSPCRHTAMKNNLTQCDEQLIVPAITIFTLANNVHNSELVSDQCNICYFVGIALMVIKIWSVFNNNDSIHLSRSIVERHTYFAYSAMNIGFDQFCNFLGSG